MLCVADRQVDVYIFFKSDGVLTGCAVGIAQTTLELLLQVVNLHAFVHTSTLVELVSTSSNVRVNI